MPYGTIKVDNITFTNGGSDTTITVSGLASSTTGNLTVTGTISGAIVRATTVSGVTVTGTTVQGASGTFTSITGEVATITSGVFAAGSATNPSISFTGDNNTGIYSPGADQVAISTGGSGRLFVDASGNVGAGTSSPAFAAGGGIQAKYATFSSFRATVGANTGTDFSAASDGKGYIYVRDNADLLIGTNNTERLRITSAGLVGVGTSSPLKELQINATTPTIRLEENSAGAKRLELSVNSSAEASIFATQSASQLLFGTVGTERMRIDSSGRVGIGTSSPGSLLDLVGGDIRLNSVFGINKSNADGYIHLSGGTSNALGGTIFCFGQSHAGNANEIHFRNSGNQTRVVIDSSGRVGIGTTSVGAKFHIDDASTGALIRISSGTNGSARGVEWYNNNTANVYGSITSDYTSGVFTYDAGRSVYAGIHAFRIGTGGEAARIDSSGRLLVGTSTSPSAGGGQNSRLVVQGYIGDLSGHGDLSLQRGEAATAITSGEEIGYIKFNDNAGNTFAYIIGVVDGNAGVNDYPGRLVFSTTADGASSPTERMRIKNNGETWIVPTLYGLVVSTAAAAGTTYTVFEGLHSGGSVGSGTLSFRVFSNGNVQNTNNSYGAISDIKLKENIVDATSQWDDIKALQVRKYNFKEGQTHTQIGLIAQEVELVSPGLVSESPDRDEEGNDLGTVTKSVNYSVLYMKAVKALQEAMERIETLEAKVAALESA